MRILQVLEASTNPAVPGNRTWLRNLHEPLLEMGHEVVLVPAEDGRRALQENDPQRRADFSREVTEVFRREHARSPFDLAFFYVMDGMVEREPLDEIRRAGVPSCNFSCNNIHQFELAGPIAGWFDLNLHAEKHAANDFQKVGANALWWPMASNPRYFQPLEQECDVDVSFVGARYGSRLEIVRQLQLQGLAVHAYGPGWSMPPPETKPVWNWKGKISCSRRQLKAIWKPRVEPVPDVAVMARQALEEAEQRLHRLSCEEYPHLFHGPVPDEEQIALYSRSRVSLGFLEVFEGHNRTLRRLSHLHLRDFEAPMCGAVYCTDYSDELAEMFEPGREVLACRNIQERVESIRRIMADAGEAAAMRRAARQRALAEHTWQRRYQTLFGHLGLKG